MVNRKDKSIYVVLTACVNNSHQPAPSTGRRPSYARDQGKMQSKHVLEENIWPAHEEAAHARTPPNILVITGGGGRQQLRCEGVITSVSALHPSTVVGACACCYGTAAACENDTSVSRVGSTQGASHVGRLKRQIGANMRMVTGRGGRSEKKQLVRKVAVSKQMCEVLATRVGQYTPLRDAVP